jgi:hypothetical protein
VLPLENLPRQGTICDLHNVIATSSQRNAQELAQERVVLDDQDAPVWSGIASTPVPGSGFTPCRAATPNTSRLSMSNP